MNRPVSDTAAALIAQLDLKPHPEGGHYRETYRDQAAAGGRAKASLIYYLLQAGEVSHCTGSTMPTRSGCSRAARRWN